VRDEAFYTEDELINREDGTKIAPSGAEVEWVEEPSYFFRLSSWQERLLKFYDDNPNFILPKTRRNEVVSFVSGGLQDLSVSRTTFKWGVPVPGDDGHIMYVWLDALTNYITSIGFPEIKSGEYVEFWPADLHMVGKDILRFHAVYWPAFLLAAGLDPPRRIFAHGWWTNEGKKISKSLGNVIDPIKLVNKYGLDQVRYFLMREVPFGNDGDFANQAMINRTNSDLANDYGNLVQRVLSMIAKNCSGAVPEAGGMLEVDEKLLAATHKLLSSSREAMDIQAFHIVLEAIWATIRSANVYVDAQAPWKLAKEDKDRMNTVLYVLAETIRRLALLTQPFMPDASANILDQLAVAEESRTFKCFGSDHALAPGTILPDPQGVFPRYREEEDH
jgi:methionyl-tRNA synthetase